jgi:hypothetical protein
MLVTIGTWVFATGLVVLSLESFEVAMAFFGIVREQALAAPENEPPLGA